jgi:hypothetical protein
MGTWICQRIFSWFQFGFMAQTIPMSILWMYNTDAAGIPFHPIPIIQTHHSLEPFTSNQYRQMAEGFREIRTTSLAEEFKTPNDGLA